MSESCPTPIPAERLLDYLLGELETGDEDRLETHLFGCATCSAGGERLAGLATSISRVIPPVLSRSRFEALEGAGVVSQGERHGSGRRGPGGLPRVRKGARHSHGRGRSRRGTTHRRRAADAQRRGDRAAPTTFPSTPPGERSLVACQHHFSETFPRDLVFALELVSGDDRRPVAEYTVFHRLDVPKISP